VALKQVDITEFIELAKLHPVLDVRSPEEFQHAHFPGATSFPLFSNEERKVVGTTYKQESREQAIKTGLDFFGPKMRTMVEEAENIIKNSPNAASHTILVHCWRGGMRSAGVAWLLDLYGFTVYTLVGGYKKFRRYVLDTFETNYSMKVIGGYTGSGKTAILKTMARLQEPVIDLESLAIHKGSAFGHLNQPEQPSQEMFENRLAMELRGVAADQPFWIEDESLRIGKILIPQPFYNQLRKASCYFLDIPFQERLQFIVKEYGYADRDKLITSVLRIQKRLGGLETKTAVNYLIEKDLEGAFTILLKYYDKWYLKGLSSRDGGTEGVIQMPAKSVDVTRNAQLLLNYCK
jgi:tRNA 2-selenouridine synthase